MIYQDKCDIIFTRKDDENEDIAMLENTIMEKITDEYKNDLLVRMAHHSTVIEGNTLTQEDTTSILIYGYIPKGMNEREYYEVKNYKKVFSFLLEAEKEISSTLMKQYHKLIMENLRDDNGQFKKTGNMVIGADFEPTKPYLVPSMIENWCNNLKYRLENTKTLEEKVEATLEQHIQFEKIHPFPDGNGRTGRLLIIHSCLKEGMPPIIIPKEEKGKYISLLQSEDIKEFTKWGLELQKKERTRIEAFYNKEKSTIKEPKNLWERKMKEGKEGNSR